MNPIISRNDIDRVRVSEASIERLRKFLLPLELAEAELKARPAAAVMIILRECPRGLEVLLGERTKREGDPWHCDRLHDPRRVARARLRLRGTTHLGLHVSDPRGAADLRRAQRLRRGSRGGFGPWRRRSSSSGSSIAATRSWPVMFSRSLGAAMPR